MKSNMYKSLIFLASLFMCLNTLKAQRTVYQYQFNGSNRDNDISFGWSLKNNTQPPTAEDEDGWSLECGEDAYLGAPYDGTTFDQISGFVTQIGVATGTGTIKPGYFGYAVVGYSENDYDDAHVSKWMFTRVLHGLKNGDEIRFKTKQKSISGWESAGKVLSMDIASMGCDRPNRLQVWLDTTTNNDFVTPNVGNTAGGTGNFNILLLDINPGLTVNGYPNNWTEIVAYIKNLPPGVRKSGRIGFRYYFEHGGYANCRARNESMPAEVNTTEEILNNLSSTGAGGSVLSDGLMVYNAAKFLRTSFTNNQIGRNGTYIGLDDFRYISSSRCYLAENINSNVWYNNNEPLKRMHFAYKGTPDCFTEGLISQNGFYFINNSNAPITIHVSTNLSQAFKISLNNSTTNPIATVGPYETKYFLFSLKPGLPLTTINNGSLTIREGGANGPILQNVKISYSILPPPLPEVTCSKFPYPITVNDSGIATLQRDAQEFNLGSSVNSSCGNNLTYSYSKFPGGNSPSNKLTYTCNDAGKINTAYLVVRVTETGATSTCPISIDVKRANPDITNKTHNYYLDYRGKMPLDSLRVPDFIGACKGIATPIKIIKKWNNSIDYLNSNGLSVGEYQVSWHMSYLAPDSATWVYTTDLNVLDTIKPRAFCKDTAKIGFTYVTVIGSWPPRVKLRDDINPFRDIDAGSYDNSGGIVTSGINKYSIYSPWYSGALQYFADSFEIQCSNIGQSFPVTLKVADASGNFSTCNSYAKIISAAQPECKNTTIAINPTTGIKNITSSDVLLNGVSGACGLTNLTLSKSSFNCNDINQTFPVTVGYKDANNVVRGCVANVTVKSYSIPEGSCQDTVKHYLTNFSSSVVQLQPLALSACSPQTTWSLTVGAFNFPSITGTKNWDFKPGFTDVSRRAIIVNDTFTCNQVYAVYDTTAPVVITTPSNITRTIPSLNNSCKVTEVIPNIFQQGTYKEWTYSFSGATTKTVRISTSDYNYSNTYWLDQIDSLNLGLTTVTLTALDNAANVTTRTFTININVLNPVVPSVGYFGATMPTVRGNFCGSTYRHFIQSPMIVPCNQTGFMWYYEVRDNYLGNILYEEDSIDQNNGAFIPIKVSAFTGPSHTTSVHFGYHDKSFGNKIYSSNSYITVMDTISPVVVPSDVIISNTNDSTFNYTYTIPSPVKYQGSCSGARWGYKISGATSLSSVPNPSLTYNANQTYVFNNLYAFTQGYPSIPADSSPTVILNNGLNTIEYFILEESGVYPTATYKYNVNLEDVSFPQMSCPTNDTIYRSAGPCKVTVANPTTQINGFTGPFSKSKLGYAGGNTKVLFNKKMAPDSITFKSVNTTGVSYKPAYTYFIFNTSGTVSFNWTYQSSSPQFFRPFATSDTVNPWKINPPVFAGFNQNNTGTQTGTFTKSVVAGEILKIGVYEGGGVAGYLRISNFSAPNSTTKTVLTQPTYPDNENYYFYAKLDSVYPIGSHDISFSLTNVNNGRTSYCTKKFVVIDSFARSLNCQNKTLYLNSTGLAELSINDVLPSSCFPVTSTYLSKSLFTGNDIGTKTVGITSVGAFNDTLRCNISVTVLDTIKPKPATAFIRLALSPAGTAILTDSMVRSFFYDNHKIVSITKAKTNFTCDDVGTQYVLLTATDSVGNAASIQAQIYVSSGFAPAFASSQTINICSRDTTLLTASSTPGYSLNYQWQIKDTVETNRYWNYYSSAANTPFMSNVAGHQFFKYRNETYVAYYTFSAIEFKKLDTTTGYWRPAFPSIAITLKSVETYKVSVYPSNVGDILEVATINNSSNAFGLLRYDRYTNVWETMYDNGLPFFSHQIAGPPANTISAKNYNMQNLFGDNGYYFTVNNLAYVYAVNHDSNNYTRAYSYNTDTVQNLGTYYLKNYDLYGSDPWTPSGFPPPLSLSSGKKILAIRNTANHNIFFEFRYNNIGFITGKDSLTTDPTGGSSLFQVKSFNNIDYIAYENLAGKLAVKSYSGSNTWSLVGAAEISDNIITKLCMNVVNNALYVVYVEASGRMYIKKLSGNTWINLGSPNDNISFNNVGEYLSIVDINNQPAIFFTQNVGGTERLILQNNWKVIPNATNATYKPNLAIGGNAQYKCIMNSTCGIFATSDQFNINLTQSPVINLTQKQHNIVKEGTANIHANTTGQNTIWRYNFLPSASILSTGTQLSLPNVSNDTTVFAYSYNGECYSDTVSTHIYLFDSSLAIYHISVKDTVCENDYHSIVLDTALAGFKYSLYIKDSNNNFVSMDYWHNIVNAENNLRFNIRSEKSDEYKIKIENLTYDAADINGHPENHINFGNDSLPIEKELTIESWVYASHPNPYYVLGVLYNPGTIWDPSSNKNWEWSGNEFNVYNANNKRTLNFPNFPNPYSWVHVSTTAGPNGMHIYYDGVLVASDTTLVDTNRINQNTTDLILGWRSKYNKASLLWGLDEFRVWNKVRTQAEIANTYNTCLTGNESGLVLYNNFSDFDNDTKLFKSVKGHDGLSQKYDPPHPSNVYITERNGSCMSGVVSNFTAPIKITALSNQNRITNYDDYFESPDSICGGLVVQLTAQKTGGQVVWYADFESDSILGYGDTLRLFTNKNISVYPTIANTACVRNESAIYLNDTPTVYYAEVEPYCQGSLLKDNNFSVSYEGDNYAVYDNPVGGNPLDIRPYRYPYGTGVDGNRVMNQSDTLWVEAFKERWNGSATVKSCVATVRKPIILKVIPMPQIITKKDSSRYEEGTVVLEATTDSTSTIQWFDFSGNFIGSGSPFTTPSISTTTSYKVRALNEEYFCWDKFDTVTATVKNYLVRRDTVLACESYTWNGTTYTQSDSAIRYVKSNSTGNDSLIILNLQIISFDQSNIQVVKSNMCAGDSSQITVASTQLGHHYMLVDSTTNSVVGQPKIGTGASLTLNTGALYQTKHYKIVATDTIMLGNRSLTCSKQIGASFVIETGKLRSREDATTCGTYNWRSKTLTQSGIYYDTIPSTQSCDSILEIHLTIFPIKEKVDSVVACSSYTWYGTTYTASTSTPVRSLGITEFGCDSLVRLHLTLNNNTATDTRVAWDSLTWINGIKYTSNNNTAQFTLTNTKGCDSLVTLHLTIINSVARTWYFPATICSGRSYLFNGNSYTTAGIHRDTLVSSSGIKDSILVLQLTVNPSYSTNNPKTICNGSVYTFNGHNYISTGVYRDTLMSITGCDSVIVTQLTVNPSYSTNNPKTICNGSVYTFNGHNYTSTGVYRDTLMSITGCDSVIVTQLTVNPKPITSSITGTSIASFNSIETYSVSPTVNSTYNWIITNGTQISGGNTNSISVQWGTVITITSVKVVETNANGCHGDTVTRTVILPVKLLKFTGNKVNNDVELDWTTASELNNKGFQVQRSFEGKMFEPIGFVNGKGTSSVRNNYQFVDEHIFDNKSIGEALYYRLKQIDFDGKEELSPIAIVVNPNAKVLGVQVVAIPNPFHTEFNIQINSEVESVAIIRIYDALGKQVLDTEQLVKVGESSVPINKTIDWEPGLYQVTVTINGKTHVARVVKY